MVTTSGEIFISGFDELEELLELKVTQSINKHPAARFRGTLKYGTDVAKVVSDSRTDITRITVKSCEGKESRIFAGFVDQLFVHDMGAGYYELEVTLNGVSIKLSQDKLSRSFQDVSQTHEDVMKKSAGTVSGASITWNASPAVAISMPVIQYIETDWEFILRLASHYNSPVIVDEKADYPNLSIGLEGGNTNFSFDNAFYSVGISKRFYELGGKSAGLDKNAFLYYKVESFKDLKMGKSAEFQGASYLITNKELALVNDEIVYTYTLSSSSFAWTAKKFNQTFIGHTILGKVLETDAETLKLDLELEDDEHLDSAAYPYNWTPETGNIMYCMPQAGTKVSLYFGDIDETCGTVVNCIRTNGGTAGKMNNPSNKHFTSEDGLVMDLDLDDMNFSTPENKGGFAYSKLALLDNIAVYFETAGSINMTAQQLFKIECKYFFCGAAKGEITAVGTLGSSTASFWMHYQFDGLGQKAFLYGMDHESYPLINDAPIAVAIKKPEKSSGWSIFGKFLAGVACAAVATAAVCLIATGVGAGAGIVLGAAAAGMAAGIFAVGTMAVTEAVTGESKSLKDYCLKGFVQGAIGAASSAIGGWGTGVIKGAGWFAQMGSAAQKAGGIIAAGTFDLAGNLASTSADNLMDGKGFFDGWGASAVTSVVTFGVFDTPMLSHVPGINKVVKHADAPANLDNVSSAYGSSRRAYSASVDAAETASSTAERTAARQTEAELSESAARRTERSAEQNLNRVRANSHSGSAARRAAREQLSNASNARRAAVAARNAARSANQAAQRQATESIANRASSELARRQAKNMLMQSGGAFFQTELSYNLRKTAGSKVIGAGVDAAVKYSPQLKQYVEEVYKDVNIWGGEE